MAELQTVAAVFDLLKVTYEVGKFLKKVRDADKTANEICDRIEKLRNVLHAVQAVLEDREDVELTSSGNTTEIGAQVSGTIHESILGCTQTLGKLQTRLGKLGKSDAQSKRSLLDKTKIAFRQPSIGRLNDELEARVHILSTELAVLQLFDQARTGATARDNHRELVQAIERLGSEVAEGIRIQREIICRQHQRAIDNEKPSDSEADVLAQDAFDSLSRSLQKAEDIHEHYTSEYFPDNESVRLKRKAAEQETSAVATPSTGMSPSFVDAPSELEPRTTAAFTIDDDEDELQPIWPLQMLNTHIASYTEQAAEKRDAGHWNSALEHFHQAIRNSEIRESRYNVVFTERVHLQEEIAELYRKQRKWGEAISTVHQLLRRERLSSTGSTSDESSAAVQTTEAEARQQHLLAAIYYDRYISNSATALTQTDDILKAERHALTAFSKTWPTLDSSGRLPGDAEHQERIELFARILEALDKTVEASNLRRLLSGRPDTSEASESIHRSSINTNSHIDDDIDDTHEILAVAIRSNETEKIHSMLLMHLDVDRLCANGKTLLMEAVEQSDESTVHRLLAQDHQADVNKANKRGLTALHIAASLGLIDMARCLLSHDAESESKDKKDETPAAKAVIGGHVEMVEVLSQHDPEKFLHSKGRDEWSLLHYAVHRSGREMIKLLLDLAPDIHSAIDRTGKNALHHCAEYELFESASALLENEQYSTADINATDSVGRNALYFAASRPPTPPRERMVQLLQSKGALVDQLRPPPRYRDYTMFRKSRRDSNISRTSVSTTGLTTVSTSSSVSRFSRAIGRLSARR